MNRSETLIYFAIGAVNILSGIFEVEWLNHLSKPLLMLSLAYFYYQKTKNSMQISDKIMLIALIFSCLGDSFLMFQDKYFILGLGCFLLAHLCYIYVFSRTMKFSLVQILPFLVYGIFMLYFLVRNIEGELKIAVFAYISVITTMGIMAILRQTTAKSYQLVLLGAIIFAVSDSCIGINKFVNAIPSASFWIMTTYITAQYLIVKGFLLGRKA